MALTDLSSPGSIPFRAEINVVGLFEISDDLQQGQRIDQTGFNQAQVPVDFLQRKIRPLDRPEKVN